VTEPGVTHAAQAASAGSWVVGPTPPAVAEMVRSLELTITRRLDGVLHGHHEGLTPGHGSEPGESRVYQPGDDVRRIDWNVSARTNETHVREQIADRDLTAWMVLDMSAAMRFGTTDNDKAQVASAAAATVGFLTARNQNRLAAVLVAGPELRVLPPRSGADQVRAILTAAVMSPDSAGRGPGDLAGALARVDALARRRGFVTVISDFAPGATGADDAPAWREPLGRLGLRHDLLAVVVDDPREREVPPIGLVTLSDPSTGRTREVRVTAEIQHRFAEEAAAERARRQDAIGRAGAELIELSTDDDWLGRIVQHVQRKRVQAVRGGVI